MGKKLGYLDTSLISDIANVIRTKTSSSEQYTLSQMKNQIDSIGKNATATPIDVLKGETAYVGDSEIEGELTYTSLYSGTGLPSAKSGNTNDIYILLDTASVRSSNTNIYR